MKNKINCQKSCVGKFDSLTVAVNVDPPSQYVRILQYLKKNSNNNKNCTVYIVSHTVYNNVQKGPSDDNIPTTRKVLA
jgi:KaiC/GvpD/RAD55 family RecA-like ATPase